MPRGHRQSPDDATPGDAGTPASGAVSQRVDKWLWHARVVRTRALAVELVEAGRVRRNRERLTKASDLVRRGDVLTIVLPARVLVLRVRDHSDRRGSPADAAHLFEAVTAEAKPDAE